MTTPISLPTTSPNISNHHRPALRCSHHLQWHLNDGWGSQEVGVGSSAGGIVGLGKSNVDLTVVALWYSTSDEVRSRDGSWEEGLLETRPEDGVGGSVVFGGSSGKGDLGEVGGWDGGQSGGSLEWETCRARVGRVEGADELGGKGEDWVVGERGVEWLWVWRLLESGTDVGRVTGLDSQDGASNGEVGL